ncbi:hypothetical protein AKJ16_DCAP27295 [Drosera capensis]
MKTMMWMMTIVSMTRMIRIRSGDCTRSILDYGAVKARFRREDEESLDVKEYPMVLVVQIPMCN